MRKIKSDQAEHMMVRTLRAIKPGERIIYYSGGEIDADIKNSADTPNAQRLLIGLKAAAEDLRVRGKARLVTLERSRGKTRVVEHIAIGTDNSI